MAAILLVKKQNIGPYTLLNIVEAPFKKKNWTLISVLNDDVQMDQ